MKILRALSAVASGMIGIRRGAAAAKDFSSLHPWHIAVAVACLIGSFVIGLVTLVNFIAP